MGPFVFLVLVVIVRSESLGGDGSQTPSESSDSAMCVCRSDITINPPVRAGSPPMNSEIECNSSTVQDIVSTGQIVAIRQLEELQIAVSSNQGTVSSKLVDARCKIDELQVTVSGNQETVTFEVRGIRSRLEEMQISVSALLALPDCSEILAHGVSKSGVYTVQPLNSGEAFQVYCDMETDGGGWTVFQRRQDGSVDFDMDFADYGQGFGLLRGEFWLGNDKLHRLTAQAEYQLRVDLSDYENESMYAVFDSFSIADVSDKYRMTMTKYSSGNAGDSLLMHNGLQFSTKDQDNDQNTKDGCGTIMHGGWWFYTCQASNLNGNYNKAYEEYAHMGIQWETWKGYYYSLKTAEMKLRPTPI